MAYTSSRRPERGLTESAGFTPGSCIRTDFNARYQFQIGRYFWDKRIRLFGAGADGGGFKHITLFYVKKKKKENDFDSPYVVRFAEYHPGLGEARGSDVREHCVTRGALETPVMPVPVQRVQ